MLFIRHRQGRRSFFSVTVAAYTTNNVEIWLKCSEDWTPTRPIIFQFNRSVGLIVAVLAAEVRNLWLLCTCQHFTWHCSCSSLLSEYIMTHTKSRSLTVIAFYVQVNHELIYTFILSVYIVAILHGKLRQYNMKVHLTSGLFCLLYIILFSLFVFFFFFCTAGKMIMILWWYYPSCQAILFMWIWSILN